MRVITIGSATQDIFLASPAFQVISSPRFTTGKAECLTLGEKIEVENCIVTVGGGATNTATTFARLGFATSICSTIGQDDIGNAILRDLQAEHIDSTHIVIHKTLPSALSILLTAQDGERSVLTHRGAAQELKIKDFTSKNLTADWIYLSSLGGHLDVIEHILTIAKKNKTPVSWNPGKKELAEASEIRRLLPLVSLLILNKEEAKMLAIRPTNNCSELARSLGRWCQRVIVTDGSRGAWAFDHGTNLEISPSKNSTGISHTGAGDAFGSGTVAGILQGYSFIDALKIGLLNAQSVIQHFGAHKGIIGSWPLPKQLSEISVISNNDML